MQSNKNDSFCKKCDKYVKSHTSQLEGTPPQQEHSTANRVGHQVCDGQLKILLRGRAAYSPDHITKISPNNYINQQMSRSPFHPSSRRVPRNGDRDVSSRRHRLGSSGRRLDRRRAGQHRRPLRQALRCCCRRRPCPCSVLAAAPPWSALVGAR